MYNARQRPIPDTVTLRNQRDDMAVAADRVASSLQPRHTHHPGDGDTPATPPFPALLHSLVLLLPLLPLIHVFVIALLVLPTLSPILLLLLLLLLPFRCRSAKDWRLYVLQVLRAAAVAAATMATKPGRPQFGWELANLDGDGEEQHGEEEEEEAEEALVVLSNLLPVSASLSTRQLWTALQHDGPNHFVFKQVDPGLYSSASGRGVAAEWIRGGVS